MATTEYRKPWTNGAHAYGEVDTVAGIKLAMYRKRKNFTVITRPGSKLWASKSCGVCGQPLSTDTGRRTFAYIDCDPQARAVRFRHYECAWQALLERIAMIKL